MGWGQGGRGGGGGGWRDGRRSLKGWWPPLVPCGGSLARGDKPLTYLPPCKDLCLLEGIFFAEKGFNPFYPFHTTTPNQSHPTPPFFGQIISPQVSKGLLLRSPSNVQFPWRANPWLNWLSSQKEFLCSWSLGRNRSRSYSFYSFTRFTQGPSP